VSGEKGGDLFALGGCRSRGEHGETQGDRAVACRTKDRQPTACLRAQDRLSSERARTTLPTAAV